MQFIRKVENLDQAEVVVVSGSLSPSVHSVVYGKIIEIARTRGAKVLLDTDGDALKVGVQRCPDVIKLNSHEPNRLVGKDLKDMNAIVGAARRILPVLPTRRSLY